MLDWKDVSPYFAGFLLAGGNAGGAGAGTLGGLSRHGLADEPWRDGSRQHGSIAVLLDFQAIEEGLYVRVVPWHGNRPFSRVEELKKSSQLFAQSLRFVFAAGKSLSLEMHSSEIARGCDHRSRLGKEER